ncbi:MAG: GHKL domain-containing protein [Methylococcales bacterium]|nr:GHKL domain-containing protein [Methylococcales bacterium]
MQLHSLSFRLFISVTFVLAVFFCLIAFVLEQGFKESAERSLQEKLQIHIYSLLSVADLTDDGELKMPVTLQDPRFSSIDSGLYASIQQTNSVLIWRSISASYISFFPSVSLNPGESKFIKDYGNNFLLHYAVIWETHKGQEQYYLFTVAEDKQFVTDQINVFRVTIRSWFASISILLILIQFFVLRWSLKPLRLIGNDLEKIEAGKKEQLDGQYPSELKGLAGNLNALILSERAHLERYRNTLADLAHSLKTPLAILTGCIEPEVTNKRIVAEQILRMNEIVEYQLQKAAAQGERRLSGEIDISVIIEKVISSLSKVYREKRINFSFQRHGSCTIYGEEGDIYEIAGNLLDNAAKWCRKNVSVSLTHLDKNKHTPYSIVLQVEDDGSGIPEKKLEDILQRGVRADERIQGHGIGMAVVKELIDLLGGQLVSSKSGELGGMKWLVYLP